MPKKSDKGVRAGSKLVGGRNSARRRWSDTETVNASKDTSAGVMRDVTEDGAGKAANVKQQNSTPARQTRKVEGNDAADLTQHAGQPKEDMDANIPEYKRTVKKTGDFDKALEKKQKELNKHLDRMDKLRKSGADGTKKAAEYRNKHKTAIENLKASIQDMKERGGPGGKSKTKGKTSTPVQALRKKGGKVSTKKCGGKTVHRKKGGRVGCGKALRGQGCVRSK